MIKDIKAYEYAIQSPYISFISLTEEEKEKIYSSSLKVWKFLLDNVCFEYYPVLTLFASEQTIKNLKRLIEEIRCEINENCRPCIENIIDWIREHSNQALYYPNMCRDLRRLIIDILILLDDWTDENLEEFLTYIIEINCNWLMDKMAIITCIFSRMKIENSAINRQLINLCDTVLINIQLKNEHDLYENLDEFLFILRNNKNYIAKIYDMIRNDKRFPKRAVQCILEFILDNCFRELGKPIDEDDIIGTVYHDIHTRYGCYLHPEYWDFIKKRGEYQKVLRSLGLPSNIYLFDRPCVFIYPFPIKKDFQKKFEEKYKNKELLWELFNLTLVHEHGHAMFRHGIYKTTPSDTLVKAQIDSEGLNNIRKKTPWIEEGLAMEMEFHYVIKAFKSSDMAYKELTRVINNFITLDLDEQSWNYAGKSIIDMYLNDKVMCYHKMLKIGERNRFKTILNFLKEYIGVWKKNPDKAQDVIQDFHSIYRKNYGLPKI